MLQERCQEPTKKLLAEKGTAAAAAAKSLQSCPTLCDPRDGSPRAPPAPGILQAGTLEWVAISNNNTNKNMVANTENVPCANTVLSI